VVYRTGYNDCLNNFLALLQTYDSSLFSNAEKLRGKIYKDVFDMRAKNEPEISEATDKLSKIEFYAVANGGLSAETIINIIKGNL